jgi:hypothetical protein
MNTKTALLQCTVRDPTPNEGGGRVESDGAKAIPSLAQYTLLKQSSSIIIIIITSSFRHERPHAG